MSTSTNPLICVPDLRTACEAGAAPTLIDVRWDPAGPAPVEEYRAGHLPGAVFADLDTDLAAPAGAGGRHPLPTGAAFQAAARRLGVRRDHPVVVYDRGDATIAARLWWMLRYRFAGQCSGLQAGGEGPCGRAARPERGGSLCPCGAKGKTGSPGAPGRTQPGSRRGARGDMKRLRSGRETGGGNPGAVRGEPGTRPGAARSARSAEGIPGLQAGGGCQFGHPDTRVLDGGYRAWVRAGLPTATGDEAAGEPGDVTCVPGGLPLVTAGEIPELARHGVLLDARAGQRFRGEAEPLDPVAGHIPGAVSAPTTDNNDGEGLFRTPEELRERFTGLGVGAGTAVAAYCGSGVTAAHEVLALRLAGFTAALYPGSWSEWITDPTRPVATGTG